MRTLCMLLVIAAATAALADDAKLPRVDLDKDDEATWRLAEAAGSCNKAQPAFVRSWCHSKTPRKARFTRRFETTARSETDAIISASLPITSHGKGFISSVVPPPISCDADVCLHPETITVFVRTKAKLAAADVASMTFTFDVNGIWRVRQWWGPKAIKVRVTLADHAGKQLGEGTLLRPSR